MIGRCALVVNLSVHRELITVGYVDVVYEKWIIIVSFSLCSHRNFQVHG